MPEQQNQDMTTALLADFSTKLRDLEERQKLMKDRLLLIGENLVKEKQETENEILEFRKILEELKQETEKIKSTLTRALEEMENFARKSEIEILQRQYTMFEPLKHIKN